MQILALERPVSGSAEPSPELTPELLRLEAAAAWRLHQEGVIRQAWFTVDTCDAVLMLECAGVEEAARRLAELPLVSGGLIRFDLLPLRPYDGFARLFGESSGASRTD